MVFYNFSIRASTGSWKPPSLKATTLLSYKNNTMIADAPVTPKTSFLRNRMVDAWWPADDIFKCISSQYNLHICFQNSQKKSQKFVPWGQVNKSLIQVMALCRTGDKPLPEMITLHSFACHRARMSWIPPNCAAFKGSRFITVTMVCLCGFFHDPMVNWDQSMDR